MKAAKTNEEKKLWQELKSYLFKLLKYLPFFGIYFFPNLKLSRKVSLRENQKDGEYQDFQSTHIINLEKKLLEKGSKLYRQISYMQAETDNFFCKGKINEKNFWENLSLAEIKNNQNIYCHEIKIRKKMKFFVFHYIECEINTVFFPRKGGEVKQVAADKPLIITWPWHNISRRTGGIFDGVEASDTREIDMVKLKNKNKFQAKKNNIYYELYTDNQEKIQVSEDQKLGYVASVGEYLIIKEMLKKVNETEPLFNPFYEAEIEIEMKKMKQNKKNDRLIKLEESRRNSRKNYANYQIIN